MTANSLGESVPPFPDDVQTAKLERVNLESLLSQSDDETHELFEACRTFGFFLLDLDTCPEGREMLEEVSTVFQLSRSLFGLREDTKKQYHICEGSIYGVSEDSLRLLKMPAQPEHDQITSFPSHTDFGSVTLLWNILGGLQVQRPDAQSIEDGWEYVKSEPGCCIVNLGDALTTFTSDVVGSNLHRVVAPPGKQGRCDRYSMAYFCRPNNDVLMKPLVVRRTVGIGDSVVDNEYQTTYTATEWVKARTVLFLSGKKPMRSHGGRMEVLQFAKTTGRG